MSLDIAVNKDGDDISDFASGHVWIGDAGVTFEDAKPLSAVYGIDSDITYRTFGAATLNWYEVPGATTLVTTVSGAWTYAVGVLIPSWVLGTPGWGVLATDELKQTMVIMVKPPVQSYVLSGVVLTGKKTVDTASTSKSVKARASVLSWATLLPFQNANTALISTANRMYQSDAVFTFTGDEKRVKHSFVDAAYNINTANATPSTRSNRTDRNCFFQVSKATTQLYSLSYNTIGAQFMNEITSFGIGSDVRFVDGVCVRVDYDNAAFTWSLAPVCPGTLEWDAESDSVETATLTTAAFIQEAARPGILSGLAKIVGA